MNWKNFFMESKLEKPYKKTPLKRKQKLKDLCKENSIILKKYYNYLQLNFHKKTTIQNYYYQVRVFLKWINKPVEKISSKTILNWKKYITRNFKKNGNQRRVYSVNHFLKWLGKDELCLPTLGHEQPNRKILSDGELNSYMEASKNNPLLHVISLFQIDGFLRPSEFSLLRISNIDFGNSKFYIDGTKTGNNYIIISPRLKKAIITYLSIRKPLRKYREYLMIIPEGRCKGTPPKPFGSFIRTHTRKIAESAGIKRHVAPYLVRASAITSDFNNYVNPRIIQRKARHKNLKTTIVYSYANDEMVMEHFEKQQGETEKSDEQASGIYTNCEFSYQVDNQLVP